jgi:hypothetical protein
MSPAAMNYVAAVCGLNCGASLVPQIFMSAATDAGDAGDASDGSVAMLAPVEAARRLGVTRSRIYALVQQGELDDVGGQTLRVTLESVERRLAANAPVGEPIRPLGAWAILALASSDALSAPTSAPGFLAGSSPGPGSESRSAVCSRSHRVCASAV